MPRQVCCGCANSTSYLEVHPETQGPRCRFVSMIDSWAWSMAQAEGTGRAGMRTHMNAVHGSNRGGRPSTRKHSTWRAYRSVAPC